MAEPCVVVLQSTRTSTRIPTDCSPFMPAPKVVGVPMPWTWMVCLIACKVCSTTGPSKYRIQDQLTFEDLLRLTFAVCFLTDSTFLIPAVLAQLLSAQTVRRRDCREKMQCVLGYGVFRWGICMERLLRVCNCVVRIGACEMAFCLSSLIAELCFVVLQATRASTFVGGGTKVHDAWSMEGRMGLCKPHGQCPGTFQWISYMRPCRT